MDLFLMGVLPIICFVILDIYVNPKVGIIAAMGMAVAMFIWFYLSYGHTDSLMVGEVAFFLILGGISLRMNKSVFFKFQPVVVGVLSSLVVAYFQFFEEPILVRYAPLMVKIGGEKIAAFINQPPVQDMLASVSGQLIIVFAAHAALVAYCAKKRGNVAWLLSRVAIYPLAIIVFVINGSGLRL